MNKPLPVLFALGLSWLALLVAVGASLRYYGSGVVVDFGDVGLHLFGYAILAALLLRVGARVPSARMLLGLFVGWQVALAIFNLAVGTAQLPGLYSLDKLILGLQMLGALLLFMPKSNAWFRGRD